MYYFFAIDRLKKKKFLLLNDMKFYSYCIRFYICDKVVLRCITQMKFNDNVVFKFIVINVVVNI
jgi:hypothetical protein